MITSDLNELMGPFRSLMRDKGYGGDFEIKATQGVYLHFTGSLENCMTRYLNLCKQEKIPEWPFVLTTYAEWHSPQDYKRCAFTVALDPIAGLRITEMLIASRQPFGHQRIPVTENVQIPDCTAVAGRFAQARQQAASRKERPYRRGR